MIADRLVDPKFGTGVVKVTPAHDPNDFEAGKRHNLPLVRVIGPDARMTAEAGAYAGLDRFEARKTNRRRPARIRRTGEDGRLHRQHQQVRPFARRIVEPLVSTQWFVKMKPLAEKAIEAVESGRIVFVPDDRLPVFYQWMNNIRDWCISRQLWWGHRIPAWHCRDCHEITVARETPAVCPQCRSTEIEQETDVLDTWFSSGLWPFSTLGWPDQTEDLKAFYPTSLLITGFDILFFWVARMIMLGLVVHGRRAVPPGPHSRPGAGRRAAEDVEDQGQRGRSARSDRTITARMPAAWRCCSRAAPGADIALKEDRMEAARAFANKLWNASRLLFLNMEKSGVGGWQPTHADIAHVSEVAGQEIAPLEDAWIFSR